MHERAVDLMQIAAGWLFPNAVLQHAVPTLETLAFDVPALEAKRDRLVTALRGMGYEVASPEGTFYLWPRSPVPDDEAFVASLERRGVLVLPGTLFETPDGSGSASRRPPSPSRLRCPLPRRHRGGAAHDHGLSQSGNAADHRSSMRPQRHTASATTQVTTKSPTIQKPTSAEVDRRRSTRAGPR